MKSSSYGLWGTMAVAAVISAGPLFAQTSEQQPTRTEQNQASAAVSLDDIEEKAATYKGKSVTVRGEVDEVFGPRIFKIDEAEWIDFDGETLVFVPAPLAALVSEGAPVTVTGTVRTVGEVELEREWGWFEINPDIEAEFDRRPMIVASKITSETGMELAIRIDEDPAKPVGTSGTSALTDLNMLAQSEDAALVGRVVNLQNARVASAAKDGGFWVNAGNDQLFVLPAKADATKVSQGQTVSVSGTVLEMPDGLRDRLGDKKMVADEEIYVYATQIKPMQ